jgi:hypothetical protein
LLLRLITNRLAIAVLALLGQLTPAVATPAFAALRATPKAALHLESCACPVVERAAASCCCAAPEPAAKSCCAKPDRKIESHVAKITPGGKCSCDRPSKAANAEPASPAPPEPVACRFDGFVVSLTPTPCGIPPSVAYPPQPPPPRV